MSVPYLSDIVNGRREISEKVAALYGSRLTCYERELFFHARLPEFLLLSTLARYN